MPTILRPRPQLSYEELTRRYRNCPDGRQKTYWQVIWLMSHPDRPQTAGQAAAMVGFQPAWIRVLIHRYNDEGPDGFMDKRAHNPGHKPLLTQEQRAELSQALLGPAPDGGLWTAPKVIQWVAKKIGANVGHTTGWNYLRNLGFTLQQPRPSNTHAASIQEQAHFKKSSPTA